MDGRVLGLLDVFMLAGQLARPHDESCCRGKQQGRQGGV
jgi:hypothetical protein